MINKSLSLLLIAFAMTAGSYLAQAAPAAMPDKTITTSSDSMQVSLQKGQTLIVDYSAEYSAACNVEHSPMEDVYYTLTPSSNPALLDRNASYPLNPSSDTRRAEHSAGPLSFYGYNTGTETIDIVIGNIEVLTLTVTVE